MSRITKDQAEILARTYIKQELDNILEEKKTNAEKKIIDIIAEYIPEEIKIAYSTNPKWFTETYLYLYNKHNRYFYCTVCILLKPQNINYILSDEDFEKIKSIQISYDNFKQEYKKKAEELELCLYKQIKTYANLEKQMPEVYKLVPSEYLQDRKLPSVNYSNIITSINELKK